MATKEARLCLQLDVEAKSLLERAALLNKEFVRGFVGRAAKAADQVLIRADAP